LFFVFFRRAEPPLSPRDVPSPAARVLISEEVPLSSPPAKSLFFVFLGGSPPWKLCLVSWRKLPWKPLAADFAARNWSVFVVSPRASSHVSSQFPGIFAGQEWQGGMNLASAEGLWKPAPSSVEVLYHVWPLFSSNGGLHPGQPVFEQLLFCNTPFDKRRLLFKSLSHSLGRSCPSWDRLPVFITERLQ